MRYRDSSQDKIQRNALATVCGKTYHRCKRIHECNCKDKRAQTEKILVKTTYTKKSASMRTKCKIKLDRKRQGMVRRFRICIIGRAQRCVTLQDTFYLKKRLPRKSRDKSSEI